MQTKRLPPQVKANKGETELVQYWYVILNKLIKIKERDYIPDHFIQQFRPAVHFPIENTLYEIIDRCKRTLQFN